MPDYVRAVQNPEMEVECEQCGAIVRLCDVVQHFIDKHGWRIQYGTGDANARPDNS